MQFGWEKQKTLQSGETAGAYTSDHLNLYSQIANNKIKLVFSIIEKRIH